MKNLLSVLLAFFLSGTSFGQITEASIAKEWKIKEVLAMTIPPEAKSPEKEKQVKEMFMKGSFSLKKDHSFTCDLGAFTIPPGIWVLNSKTGEVEVFEKITGNKPPESLIGFVVKLLSQTQAIFTFPDGDVVMFTLRVEAK